jgi:hypothetical protein
MRRGNAIFSHNTSDRTKVKIIISDRKASTTAIAHQWIEALSITTINLIQTTTQRLTILYHRTNLINLSNRLRQLLRITRPILNVLRSRIITISIISTTCPLNPGTTTTIPPIIPNLRRTRPTVTRTNNNRSTRTRTRNRNHNRTHIDALHLYQRLAFRNRFPNSLLYYQPSLDLKIHLIQATSYPL